MSAVIVNRRVENFLRDPSMVEKARDVTTMSPSILKEAERLADELAELITDELEEDQVSRKRRQSNAMRPQLAPPRQTGAEATAGTRDAGKMLASMLVLLEGAKLSKLAFNAYSAAVQGEARDAGNAKLVEDYESALNAVSEMVEQLAALKDQLAGLSDKAKALERQLADAEAALAELDPDTPEYEAAMSARDTLSSALAIVKSDLARVQGEVRAMQSGVAELQKIADDLFVRAGQAGVDLPRTVVEKDVSNIARMLALMTQLGELMLEVGETLFAVQRELLKVQEDARITQLNKDAEKAEKEMAKAEALNKAMGCVGKILGAIVTAVSLVGAIFTGGASLALAGIGLALMMADEIYKGVTGNSFMEEAFKPLMKVLEPILQYVMNIVSDMLVGLGVDAQTAKMAAMIVVSVVIAAAVVALAVTGAGSAIAKVASSAAKQVSKVLTKVMEKTIAKLVPQMLKKSIAQMTKKMSGTTSKMFDAVSQRLGLSTDVASKQIYASNLGRVAAGVNFGKTVITSGLDVGAQVANKEVEESVVSMDRVMFLQEQGRKATDDLVARLIKSSSSWGEPFAFISEAIGQSTSVAVAVIRAIRGGRAA
ncbi:type III secretion system translocon subunit SctE [Solimicrobium silvestre]|uniref:Translocator protein BipB n=1 Tax=Solimicrobium silvestre TaxID=2099400 RepID=A0A2S9H1L3_9BURK|nr:type III secretion system translocon subunit SctE [Solimicrobium silvestre]PRC93869.1 Secretion system effector C (SseC) like family [Solimicrobium silvestre]